MHFSDSDIMWMKCRHLTAELKFYGALNLRNLYKLFLETVELSDQ